jgi:DNA polymerase III alpha subunit (gram-positive type)
MIYFALDCEASGPMPPLYNLLSIGVTVVRPEGDRHEIGETWYAELKPIFPGFEPEAIEICGLDPDKLKKVGVEPGEAMRRLRDWVLKENRPSGERPVFVGHNAVFDWAYINYYFKHFEIENPFGYKGIDTKSLAMGVLRTGWNDTSKENLETVLDLPPQDPARVHRADYDSMVQAKILQKLLDYGSA